MDSLNDPSDSAVFESYLEAFESRRQARRELPAPISESAKERMVRALIDYANVLEQHDDFSEFDTLDGESRESLKERGVRELMDLGKELDKIRHNAGHHAEVKED